MVEVVGPGALTPAFPWGSGISIKAWAEWVKGLISVGEGILQIILAFRPRVQFSTALETGGVASRAARVRNRLQEGRKKCVPLRFVGLPEADHR
jgi:hypothetical protein